MAPVIVVRFYYGLLSEAYLDGDLIVIDGELLSFCQKNMTAAASGEKKNLPLFGFNVLTLVHHVKVISERPL